MSDLNKIKDRMSKLLAMAQDSSSPEEAAIAASRARHLMDKYQIDSWDVEAAAASSFSAKNVDKGYKFTPQWRNILATAVAKYNDCQATMESSEGKRGYLHLSFRGMTDDVELATQMYKFLAKACETQCKAYMIKIGMGGRYVARIGDAFKKNFASALCSRLKMMTEERDITMATSTGTSLIIVKAQLVTAAFGDVDYGRVSMKFAGDSAATHAAQAGAEAGDQQEILKAVE